MASLPWTHPSGAPAGCVALLRRAAEERGADLRAVDPWVLDHGGTIASTRLGNRPLCRRGDAGGTHEVPYYVVPVAALEAEAAGSRPLASRLIGPRAAWVPVPVAAASGRYAPADGANGLRAGRAGRRPPRQSLAGCRPRG